MNKQFHPVIPSEFLEKNTVGNMAIGDVGYVSRAFTLCADTHQKMWVSTSAQINKDREINDPEGRMQRFMSMTGTARTVKIERQEHGFKVYLYEYQEYLKKITSECEESATCSLSESCHCNDLLRSSLFSCHRKEPNDDLFIPVIAFDETAYDFEDIAFLRSLTAGTIKTFNQQELHILLEASDRHELFELSQKISLELTTRNK
jgi:hypothetical protein